jgi:D-arabinose 1-dehydrogenase-like Zn-dependent alcohol dehydrogenase
MEKEIKSVANLAQRNVLAFLELAGQIPITPTVETLSLEAENRALRELKVCKIRGAKVLIL